MTNLCQKRWLNPEKLEQEFGFSKSTQAKMRMHSNSSTLPYCKVGKFVRYDRIEIEDHQVQGGAL